MYVKISALYVVNTQEIIGIIIVIIFLAKTCHCLLP